MVLLVWGQQGSGLFGTINILLQAANKPLSDKEARSAETCTWTIQRKKTSKDVTGQQHVGCGIEITTCPSGQALKC
jgi:hypothetical protein